MKLLNILVRVILFLTGAAGLGGFIVPLLKRRIINIGNVAGLIVCAAFILYALYMPRIHQLAQVFWQKRTGKVILSLFFAALTAGILSVITMTAFMIKAANTKPEKNATVIVLGCKVYDKSPSMMLAERLDAAIEYLNANPESVCIVSGGQGADENISEAECMYHYLSEHGIASERIYQEDQSTSTRENLKFSYDIIQINGFNENIAIVTNEFHEYRAGMIAGELGLSYGAVCGKTAIWLFPTYYVRELFAILFEWIF
ncbi:MAG: YdcF family protein [Lachnospiraceae bacterium]|nr:YdcF family protein [Lachnospiraceae bacterium]